MKNKEEVLLGLNLMCENTLNETLNIKYVDLGEDFLVATMPVNASVHQPDGILNGSTKKDLSKKTARITGKKLFEYSTHQGSFRSARFFDNQTRSTSEIRPVNKSSDNIRIANFIQAPCF